MEKIKKPQKSWSKFHKEFESESNKKDGERSFGTNENKCTV